MRLRPGPILLTLLATGGLTAAKPVPPGDRPGPGATDTLREDWRAQAVANCIDTLHNVPDLGPDDLESICGCAANRVLAGRTNAALPPMERGAIPPAMNVQVMACTGETRPDRASQVARLIMRAPAIAPPVAAPPPADAKPEPGPDDAAPAEGEGGDVRDWARSIGLPDWLTGASLLWWIALGIFLFGLLALKIGRRDPRNDLTGPPASMRKGARPQPPRRPDLPH